MFDDVLALYRAEHACRPDLANAAPVDFTFDALAKVMRMIGIDDTTAHLRDPGVVQSFLDDAEQLRDGLEDFADYAKALSGGGNYAGVLLLGAEKVLKEFRLTEDMTHIRAERVVTLASDLELFSKQKQSRDALGDVLAQRLDARIGELKRLCRNHFGPSHAVLAPLADLNFDHIERQEVLRIIDDAIAKVDALPSEEMHRLDAEGLAIIHDMRRELDDFRAAIAEATSEEFAEVLDQRMAQSAGALGLTLARFAQRSVTAAGSVERGIVVAKRGRQGVQDLSDIVQWVLDFFSNSPPPGR